jgi:hypothetical protein
MELNRLHGFAIEPQRTVDEDLFNDPLGGRLTVRDSLRVALDNSLRTAEKSGRMTDITLKVNQDPNAVRTCPVRDAALSVAFGDEEEADAAAHFLGTHLSKAMDERSPECLFLLAAYAEKVSKKSRVAFWIFPQDEAFRFTPGQEENDIELLTEIFSRTSALRKMALFEGKNIATNFIQGKVLDYQTGRADDVAGFWIRRFLEAVLSITPAGGTKVLTDALKRASDADLNPAENQQVHSAAMAIHTMPQTHWSLEEVANNFLSGKAREVFLGTAENEATRTSTFELDRAALERGLSFRNFRLPGDVWVSAPLDQVGDDKLVQVEPTDNGDSETGPGERVRVEAEVIQDRLGSRRA